VVGESMRHYDAYTAVKRFPTLKGYLEHFRKVSINNDVPGMLSFFFVQGMVASPFVRIPMENNHLDPRVHVFWIQASRTGKSAAWEFVGDILRDIEVSAEMYTTGSDAGLIGGWEKNEDSNTWEVQEGLLAGHKALNFDEGSILLSPGKFSQETVLYLQSACNPIGSNANHLVKHNKMGPIKLESLVSLWATTYPPKGVKDYVLTRGIFQRVLLYWKHWTLPMRKAISEERSCLAWADSTSTSVSYDELTSYFINLRKRLVSRILKISGMNDAEWDDLNRSDKEDILQQHMRAMFTKSDSFNIAMLNAVDNYYELIESIDYELGDVVASFIPAIVNYTIIFACHIAMLDESWEVTGDHVEMAEDILYDLYNNLITWLEEEVEVGSKAAEKRKKEGEWLQAYRDCEPVDFDDVRGDGWVRKTQMKNTYGKRTHVGKNAQESHFEKWCAHMFEQTRDGVTIFVRLQPEYRGEDYG